MFLKVGDIVQYSKDLLTIDSSKTIFSGKKLSVLKVELSKITTIVDVTYNIFFICDGVMCKEEGLDDNGFKTVNNKLVKVFEPWDTKCTLELNIKVPDENDRCKLCGTVGKNHGLSCVCPDCGNVIWGI